MMFSALAACSSFSIAVSKPIEMPTTVREMWKLEYVGMRGWKNGKGLPNSSSNVHQIAFLFGFFNFVG